ncbi:MAG TPA: hypothetical protein VN622_01925 [Clostridia bacterium]|nr:hypothetical protein [Clostridia bacterium]
MLGFCFLATVVAANAQQNELAITVGGQFPRNNLFDTGASFAVGGNYASRLLHVPLASLYFEVSVVAGPKSVLRLPSRSNYSSLFIAPGLKLKLAPEFPVSPYFAVGGGFARFHSDATATTSGESVNTGVFDYGAGLDMKIFPALSVRGEVRDFFSGSPSFSALGDTGRQHNVVAQTGIVLRF